MELTKEYFEEHLEAKLKNVATKDDLKGFATNDDLKLALSDQTSELKRYSDEQTENLARIIATSIVEPMDARFNRLESLMDVRDRVRKIERHLNMG